ncbi:hypothetical protein [Bacillus cereus group sp. BfR-BA-01492]|uniref:hypothetical protein n=1 Tax=Bacillus cereus group sp. BfR-BA-01492 TaxID=2920361 RepID=UPI001F560D11|nr:hypothetical protein [Bacillus cereus group sp. BfR-BA-01492]
MKPLYIVELKYIVKRGTFVMNQKKWILSSMAFLFVATFVIGFSNWDTLHSFLSDFGEGFAAGFFN